ncbi:MAG: potassium channel protein [Armatimonadetes bacterium]|nr:potassium channel protein [Akkermansiaceae bacterium]
MSSPTRNLFTGLCFMAAVTLFGVAGYMIAGWDFSDAIYMVVISIFTVGYGEVRPVGVEGLRGFTMGLIVLGCFSVIFLSGALVQFLLEGQIHRALGNRRMNTELKKLEKHAIICGYGRIGRMVAADLKASRRPFVIIDRDGRRLEDAREAGFLTLEGEATEEATLLAAGVARAIVLATVLPSDATNVFITLSARDLNPTLTIIARGEDPSTERKLFQAGANRVVLPAHIGAERISHLILFPEAVEIIDDEEKARHFRQELGDLGLEMEEAVIAESSPWIGRSVGELETNEAFLVVALHRNAGGTELRPARSSLLHAGDGVVALGRGANLSRLLEERT